MYVLNVWLILNNVNDCCITMSILCFQPSLYEIPSISPSSFSQHFRSLLDEADEMDSIHDVTLQAGDRTFPAHKYILSMRSEFFRKQFMSERCGNDEELEVRKSEDAVGCDLLIFEKIPPDMLEYALQFIYTDSCELLVHGSRPRVSGILTGQNQVKKKKSYGLCISCKRVLYLTQLWLFHDTCIPLCLLSWPGFRGGEAYQQPAGLGPERSLSP